MAELIGQEIFSGVNDFTQVYKATHDGTGNSLSHMNKSFISFTFGDKAIEDFGLIVTISERLERNAYASFTDLTSSYDVTDGQLYWGSKVEPNQIDLILSTDGMLQNQLDNFKEWFAPGKIRELVLSEHPNRAIFARVGTAPAISMVPFEKETSINIGGFSYSTSTTLYRGDISLSFIMDDPYWFAKNNYMPFYINKRTLEPLEKIPEENTDLDKVNSLHDKDMIKVMIEDGIPYQNALMDNLLLGNNLKVTKRALTDVSFVSNPPTLNTYLGVTVGETSGATIDKNNPQYLFYSGTTKSFPTIKFSITPSFDDNGYFNSIKNKYTTTDKSYIQIGENKMLLTTPSILTGYNQAVYLFRNSYEMNRLDLLEQIKNSINNYYIRAWAIACVNAISHNSINDDDQNTMLTKLSSFFDKTSFAFTINSKTGEATGKFTIQTLPATQPATFQIIEENVGDMICSDYLIIEGRNYLNSEGEITEDNCHKVTSDMQLSNFFILFKNMYL